MTPEEEEEGTPEPEGGQDTSWRQKPVSRESVLAAMRLFEGRDRDIVLREHGFRRARDYVVVHGGQEYDSKALYGIAYGIEYPDDVPIRHRGLSGGSFVVSKLQELGFEVRRLNHQAPAAKRAPQAWIVRAGSRGENEELARDEDVALIGWSELGELAPDITRAELKERIRTVFDEQREPSLNAQVSTIHRFINEVEVGDVVVLPLRTRRRHAAVGVVEGAYRYRADGPFEGRDAHYQRPVRWLARELSYDRFDEDLAEAFGAQGTLSQIARPDAAERILAAAGISDGRTRRIWWVCQGTSYEKERELGVMWAPMAAADGTSRVYWRSLRDAQRGDLVLHYANGALRAVSKVTEPAVESDEPAQFGSADRREGWLVRSDYLSLEKPIGIDRIPVEWRVAEGSPFAKTGIVSQGYFFPLSDRFVSQIADKLPELGLRDGGAVADVSYARPTFDVIRRDVEAAGLRISEQTLRRYHLSLETRGFVILAGVSGGGKTWLAELYAKAVAAEQLVVPVAPNWTTNEDLIGYRSPIDGKYRHTDFSRFLLEAATEWADASARERTPRSFHLILDELNLARVEYYFAKFLSAMERRARYETATIQLSGDLEVQLTPNLKFIGTVNVDETTFGLADKVYDRAQLIEITAPRSAIEDHLGDRPYTELVLRVWDAVSDMAPFAFRVLDEVAAYVEAAAALHVDWRVAVDEQLLQKVLPKLNGTDPRAAAVLDALVEISTPDLPLTRAKAVAMREAFAAHGFVSYF